ncbi:tetratricopeptide repeat protein [Nonomuraea sp. NPDC050643]|uniref:tetratricopeptide repeat protein n=1 Tax=Nonomuraea sp. NPDC050643 TaxID=3155660 RepID=UPI0033DCDA92
MYQAARDQTINQVTQHSPRRPLPEAGTVQVPVGLAGLPRRPAATFVGRDGALTALRQALQDRSESGVINQAVLGLGGVGKSELALQYAHRHRGQHPLVWWIDADGPEQIRAGLAALARALTSGIDSMAAEQATVQEAAAWTLSWLTAHPGWLVIFDNLEEAAHVEPYLARLAHGHVLITTRRDIGWQQMGIAPLRLDMLERQASLALLSGLLGPNAAGQIELSDRLADHLGDLPLALTQAAAYIVRTPRMTLSKYLELLKRTPARMYATAATAGGDAERVMAKVLTLSHSHIDAVNPLAGHVLNLLACYAPDKLLCTVLDGLPEADELQIDEALALLASYSLITLTSSPVDPATGQTEDMISMHRLIQAVTLHRLTPDQRDHIRGIAADLLLAALPDDPGSMHNWPAYRALLPHARNVLPLNSSGLHLLVAYLGASGDYTTAFQLQRQIHNQAMATLGAEHPHTLATGHDLAYWMGVAGDAVAARDQFAALLPTYERILGAEHPDTLHTRLNLAAWTGQAGDVSSARDQFAALLPIYERVLGAEHPDTLTTRLNLARWAGEAGDAAAARDQFAALLPIRGRVLGAEHPHTLITRNQVARWTGRAGDAAGARDQFAALLPIYERVQGADHPATLITRSQLARWTGRAGDAAAARDQFAALLPICERVLGAEHPHTITTRHDLATWTERASDAGSNAGDVFI